MPLTDDEQQVVDLMAARRGRPLTKQEVALTLAQDRLIGDLPAAVPPTQEKSR